MYSQDHVSLISRDQEKETLLQKNIMRKTFTLPVPKLVGQEWIKPNFSLNIKSFPVSSFIVRPIDSIPLKYKIIYTRANTAWKVTKYRVFSCPYFPIFSPNTWNTDQKKLRIWALFVQRKLKAFTSISKQVYQKQLWYYTDIVK